MTGVIVIYITKSVKSIWSACRQSVTGYCTVNLQRPGVYPSGNINHLGESLLKKKVGNSSTSAAGMANNGDRACFVQFALARRNFHHGYRDGGPDFCNLDFPYLPDIDQQPSVIFLAASNKFSRGDVFDQNYCVP